MRCDDIRFAFASDDGGNDVQCDDTVEEREKDHAGNSTHRHASSGTLGPFL